MSKGRILFDDQTIHKIPFSKSLMFDTNVWLRIHGCYTNGDPRSVAYSALYKVALENSVKILIPQIIVSEFINVSLKNKKELCFGESAPSGKIHSFAEYPEWVKDIADDLYHVLNDCTKVDDGFTAINVAECLQHCASNKIDVNDVIIRSICQRLDLFLVTDDADFRAEEIDIITANRKMIK